MKAKKTNKEKKPHSTQFAFPCGDFQKMAEMMKSCCPGESDIMDCCSMMKTMMDRGKGAEAKEAKGTKKPEKAKKTGEQLNLHAYLPKTKNRR